MSLNDMKERVEEYVKKLLYSGVPPRGITRRKICSELNIPWKRLPRLYEIVSNSLSYYRPRPNFEEAVNIFISIRKDSSILEIYKLISEKGSIRFNDIIDFLVERRGIAWTTARDASLRSLEMLEKLGLIVCYYEYQREKNPPGKVLVVTTNEYTSRFAKHLGPEELNLLSRIRDKRSLLALLLLYNFEELWRTDFKSMLDGLPSLISKRRYEGILEEINVEVISLRGGRLSERMEFCYRISEDCKERIRNIMDYLGLCNRKKLQSMLQYKPPLRRGLEKTELKKIEDYLNGVEISEYSTFLNTIFLELQKVLREGGIMKVLETLVRSELFNTLRKPSSVEGFAKKVGIEKWESERLLKSLEKMGIVKSVDGSYYLVL